MDIRMVPVSCINPAPYNPRRALQPTDAEYRKLKRSIDEFGLVDPLIWNERTGNLVGGHQRLRILVAVGVTEVPCSVVDLDPEREKALNIALNKIQGEWDEERLRELLAELSEGDLDMNLTGFDDAELEALLRETAEDPADGRIIEDDFDAEAEARRIEQPATVRGDVWTLGRHRLMCGDATVRSDVDRLMAGRRAAMVFTDPPYNVAYVGKTRRALTIRNDSMPPERFTEFLQASFANMAASTTAGGAIYICHADAASGSFRSAAESSGWLVKQTIIWVKSQLVIGRQDYQWRHEPIFYGWKAGAAHRWFGGRRQSTVIDDVAGVTIARDGKEAVVTLTSGTETIVLRVSDITLIHAGDDSDTTVWRFEKPARNAEHPTMKPIGLPARAIRNSSLPGDAVQDLFGGAGSTLMASEQLDRHAYLMELDPVYCDVIVHRWEQFTGQKAVKEDGSAHEEG